MTSAARSRYWFHRHTRVTLAMLSLVVCAATMVATEFAARLIFPQWAPATEHRAKFWVYDAELGWAHVPSQRGQADHPDFSVRIENNSLGMRDTEYSVERTGKKRMLVVGDSFGWGFGVEHHQRFSEILEENHPDWEIINASVAGYGTDQQYLFLKRSGMALRPDVVLLLFCDNDFQNNVRSDEYHHFKPHFTVEKGALKLHDVPVPAATMEQRLKRFLVGRSFLGSKLHAVADRVRAKRASPSGSRTPQEDDALPSQEVTSLLLQAIHDLCRENGCQFVIVSVPMGAEKRAVLRRIAHAAQIPFLPLDDALAASSARVRFEHDFHWNPHGHSLVAAAIDAFLFGPGFRDPVVLRP